MPQHPFELLAQGQAIPLVYGATFTRAQFPMLQPSSSDGMVAQVGANPQSPAQLGLQNLTNGVWTTWMPDGTQQQVAPGQSVLLVDGLGMQWGALRCSVRATGAGTSVPQPASQPYYQQPQVQQPYQEPYRQQPSVQPQQVYSDTGGAAWPPAPNPMTQPGTVNDSGTGSAAVLPAELRGFNGGAFLCSWLWAVNMKSYLGLLCLIPYLNLVFVFVLGYKGNEWAWQNRRWDGVQQFKDVQKAWLNAGLILLVIDIVLAVAYVALKSR